MSAGIIVLSVIAVACVIAIIWELKKESDEENSTLFRLTVNGLEKLKGGRWIKANYDEIKDGDRIL